MSVERPVSEEGVVVGQPAEVESPVFESADHENSFAKDIQVMAQVNPAIQGAQVAAQEEGALVGWLVTFGHDAKGMSTEIRSGKYFVGRQRLRKHDMIIADSGVSTPHCLIAASPADGLKIQDLMSEQGTFVKRRGSQSYVPVHDVIAVEHGDFVRFGGYEVLICLVPSARK